MKAIEILKACETRPGADEGSLRQVEQRLRQTLPDDYRALLLESDGLEGFIGPEAYLILWRATDLVSLNEDYLVSEFAPGVTLFGTDGGELGYGYRRVGDRVEYITLPLVGMEPGAVAVAGMTLIELLARASEQ